MENIEKIKQIESQKEEIILYFWETLFSKLLIYIKKYIRAKNSDIYPFFNLFCSLANDKKRKYFKYFKWMARKNLSENSREFMYCFCMNQLYYYKYNTNSFSLKFKVSSPRNPKEMFFVKPDEKYTLQSIFNKITSKEFSENEKDIVFQNFSILLEKNNDFVKQLNAVLVLLKPYYEKNNIFSKISAEMNSFEFTFTYIKKYLSNQAYEDMWFSKSDLEQMEKNTKDSPKTNYNDADLLNKMLKKLSSFKSLSEAEYFKEYDMLFLDVPDSVQEKINNFPNELVEHLINDRNTYGLLKSKDLDYLCRHIQKKLRKYLFSLNKEKFNSINNKFISLFMNQASFRLKYLSQIFPISSETGIKYLPYLISNYLFYNFQAKAIPVKKRK